MRVSFDALCCGQNSHKMLPFDDGGTDLERQQQKQPSEADPATDVPASEYARLQWFLVAWLVGDCALLTWSNVPTYKEEIANFEALIFPISISLCILYFFGTHRLVGRRQRAVVVWVMFWIYQAAFTCVSHVGARRNFSTGTGISHLLRVHRGRLRMAHERPPLGAARARVLGHDPHHGQTIRDHGVPGRDGGHRRHARSRTGRLLHESVRRCFSMSLIYAWLFSVAIFEVARVDAHAAMTKLRLSAVEAVALTCTGLLVLFSLAELHAG